MASNHVYVVKGPTKFDLMIALFHGGTPKKGGGKDPNVIMFRGEGDDGPRYTATVDSVSAADSSRESWDITGHVTQTAETKDGKVVPIDPKKRKARKARISYLTNKRTGNFEYLD